MAMAINVKNMSRHHMDCEITNSDEKLATLSERLVYALTKLGITQAELARRIRIKPQAIHYLCSSRSKKSSFTYEIADALNISSFWLGCGEGSMQLKDDPDTQLINSQKRVPVLDWKQIKNWINQNNEAGNLLASAKEYILTNVDIAVSSFAFRLQDKSMYPRFDQDTIVIVNPERTPRNKDFVIVYFKEIDDFVFRQYEFENNTIILKPVNTAMYKTITMGKDDSILGVMVEARWQI